MEHFYFYRSDAAISAGIVDYFEFAFQEAKRKEDCGKYSSASQLRIALQHLRHFLKGRSLMLADLHSTLVADFCDYLMSLRLSGGTVGLYINALRGVYHRAVKEHMVMDCHPFSDLRLSKPSTSQPTLSEIDMSRFVTLSVKPCSWQWLTHRFCCCSYYLCGMPPVDLIHLPWSQIDLVHNTLIYNRQKTGHGGMLKLSREAKSILLEFKQMYEHRHQLTQHGWDRCKCISTWKDGYVFPFIGTANRVEAYHQLKNTERIMNHCLKKLGAKINLPHLSLYAFRRAWATTAYVDYKADMSDISLGLGHANVRTTYLYIQQLDHTSFYHLQDKMMRGLRKRVEQLQTK